MINVLDNVYDLVTLNMEQRFPERVALRFYNKDTDEVTAVLYKDNAGHPPCGQLLPEHHPGYQGQKDLPAEQELLRIRREHLRHHSGGRRAGAFEPAQELGRAVL